MALSVPHAAESLAYPKLKNFYLFNFTLESGVLKDNPLGDSPFRNNPLLTPKAAAKNKPLGLIFVLSGFAGNATKQLGDRGFEETALQQLDRLFEKEKIPFAHYLFVDAWTFWGGSQFLNSKAIGRYEDYIVKELYPALYDTLSINSNQVAVVGHSSGGYGALHLASAYPELFPYCGALAPDCFFEASLLPDLYKAAPFLKNNKSYQQLLDLHQTQKLLKQPQGFQILNSIAMAACYSPSLKKKDLEWPLNFETGLLDRKIWKRWQEKDPLVFLPQRRAKVKKLQGLFLDVGSRDEFQLQFGVRQLHRWLRDHKISHHFSEFDGGHFDGQSRFPLFWEWLQKKW